LLGDIDHLTGDHFPNRSAALLQRQTVAVALVAGHQPASAGVHHYLTIFDAAGRAAVAGGDQTAGRQGAAPSCCTPTIVLVVHSKLNTGHVRGAATGNDGRLQLVELPQATPLLVVGDRFGWRGWLRVGETARRGSSTSGSYRFHPRPGAYRDRSRLGHQLGLRSSCRSSSASSVNASSTDTSTSCCTPKTALVMYRPIPVR
jgi:hypothetical protein